MAGHEVTTSGRRPRRAAVALGMLALTLLASLFWPPLPPRPSASRLASLSAQRDELERRLQQRLVAAGEASLLAAPRGGLMIGIPTQLTATLLERTVTGLFGETTIAIQDVEARAAGEVKAQVLFSKRTVGAYELRIRIRKVTGMLRPSKPTIGFADDQVNVVLPVRLVEGRGEADLRLRWDSKGLAANVICGDVDVTRRVAGRVLSREYRLAARFSFSTTGDAILLQPHPLTSSVRLFVAPDAGGWEALFDVLHDQRKGCEIAIQKGEVSARIAELVARGFEVKLPDRPPSPIAIPIGALPSIEYGGATLALRVTPTGVLVASDRLWYAADVALSSSANATGGR